MTLVTIEIIENYIILLMFSSIALFIIAPRQAYSFLKKSHIVKYMDAISYVLLIVVLIQPFFFTSLWNFSFPFPTMKSPIVTFILPMWVIVRSHHIKKYGEINTDYKPERIRNLIKAAKLEITIIIIFCVTLVIFIINNLSVG